MLNTLRRGRRALLALCLGLVASFGAQATYSNVYFFGDSLSDTGNLYTASGGIEPPPPYYNGRFSNGPLWVETVASGLGFASAANPFLLGGNNYAFAGAFTGTGGLADPLLGGTPTGLQTQVAGYWSTSHVTADSNALYVVEIGSNDLLGIASTFSGVSPADYAARLAGAQLAISNLLFSLNFLIDRGARNFLIANAPNLGVIPLAGAFQLAATDASIQYNNLLVGALAALGGNPNIVEFDLFDLITGIVADAQAGGQTYGMTNGTIPCIIDLSTCDDSVFFDPQHPTAQVHALAGQAALALVPEPRSSLLLVATALLLAVIAIRRRTVPTRRPTLAPLGT
ncbi:MAG TPA: SGNH/GDSL hydrolase family protein [Azonexus sp.]|nr:SGNH/GDSL hydrolase family protein [Azonexus sp.]